MQLDLAEELDEVGSIIGDKHKIAADDPFRQYPVRLPAQTKVVYMGCFKTGRMSHANERLMQALVD